MKVFMDSEALVLKDLSDAPDVSDLSIDTSGRSGTSFNTLLVINRYLCL